MNVSLDWCSHPALTTFYLGYCHATRRKLVHPALASSIAAQSDSSPSDDLAKSWLDQISLTLKSYTSTDPHAVSSREAVTMETISVPPSLRTAFDPLHAALDQAMPDWAQQMPARVRPLRELWQARGAGYLRQLTRHLGRSVESRSAGPVAAVFPISGGFGIVLPDANGILLEAPLTDLDDRVPEILRLAWLVTLQEIELTVRADETHEMATLTAEERRIAAMKMTLTLADELEWMPVGLHTFERASALWL